MPKKSKVYKYEYVPILIGAKRQYGLILDEDEKPIVFKTATNDMMAILGEVETIIYKFKDIPYAIVETGRGLLTGRIIAPVKRGHPAWVMEHLKLDGRMEFLVGPENILHGDLNFINYGIPGKRYIRIDAYTGEYEIING